MSACVISVSAKAGHDFSKSPVARIVLLAGLGVDGDAHCGELVKHRSRVAQDPMQPNLRQVHLMHSELFAELAPQGFALKPGDLGENICTRGIDLLALPQGCLLRIGATAVVQVTGLRNPCAQICNFMPGLLQAVLGRAADGSLVRKAGIMGVVLVGGEVRTNDAIVVTMPSKPYLALERV